MEPLVLGSEAKTQTLQLQYLQTLNLHLMKVQSLLLFTESCTRPQTCLCGEKHSSQIINCLDFILSKPFLAFRGHQNTFCLFQSSNQGQIFTRFQYENNPKVCQCGVEYHCATLIFDSKIGRKNCYFEMLS